MYPFLLAAALSGSPAGPLPGPLVIAGGGPTPPEVVQRALELAGGKGCRVLIVPQASARPDAGQPSLRMWQRAGAERVSLLDLRDRDAALRAVTQADLIWMPGGSQLRLMRALTETGIAAAIRDRSHHGATVGGTSAGAAVMSQVMLSGILGTDGVSRTVEAAGVGLWPDVIVDQHYLRRSRAARLREAVLRHPDKPGVGIDECTAVVVQGRHFEVIGASCVEVLDGRRPSSHPAATASSTGVSSFLLKPGMRFDLDKGVLSPPRAAAAAEARAEVGGH